MSFNVTDLHDFSIQIAFKELTLLFTKQCLVFLVHLSLYEVYIALTVMQFSAQTKKRSKTEFHGEISSSVVLTKCYEKVYPNEHQHNNFVSCDT